MPRHQTRHPFTQNAYLMYEESVGVEEARAVFSTMESFRAFCDARGVNPGQTRIRAVTVKGKGSQLGDHIYAFYGRLDESSPIELCAYSTSESDVSGVADRIDLRYVRVPVDPGAEEALAAGVREARAAEITSAAREKAPAERAAVSRAGVMTAKAGAVEATEEDTVYVRPVSEEDSIRDLVIAAARDQREEAHTLWTQLRDSFWGVKLFWVALILVVVAVLAPKPQLVATPEIEAARRVNWLPIAAQSVQWIELPGLRVFEAEMDAMAAKDFMPRKQFRAIGDEETFSVPHLSVWREWSPTREYVSNESFMEWFRDVVVHEIHHGWIWRPANDASDPSLLIYDLQSSTLFGQLSPKYSSYLQD